MRRLFIMAIAMFAMVQGADAAETTSFSAADGSKVFGDVYRPEGPAKATILLFHQAGSNRAEYMPIAPKLAALGYNVLAIDQRAGGSLWGKSNETAAAGSGGSGYFDALPDLEGALAYAVRTWPGKPAVVWGSSYSASLVFFLAARHPNEIVGLLSFSPGEYFSGESVAKQAAQVHCPVFITSVPAAGEIAAARELYDEVPGARKVDFVPTRGTHGSSTLRTDSNPAGAAEIWLAVERFLSGLPERPPA
jgi:pimeloyl-ACP methyl ester carboxylesterase